MKIVVVVLALGILSGGVVAGQDPAARLLPRAMEIEPTLASSSTTSLYLASSRRQ